MTNINKLLNKEKDKIDELVIPEEMESRLRSALKNIPNRRKSNFKGKIAVLIIGVLLLGYNMDTLAYYGKLLVGYENVMGGTLEELNQLGKGQIVDKSYTFKNGAKVTLDGVMLDDNNLIVFTTIYGGVNKEGMDSISPMYLSGVLGSRYHGSGHGLINDLGTEIKLVNTYDAPKFYNKKMKLNFSSNGEKGEISFNLDRNKAMGRNIKLKINEKIELGERSIKIQSLLASPTATVVKGEIQNIVELGLDYIKEERLRPDMPGIILIADGEKIKRKSSGLSTDNKGVRFQFDYDALPVDTKEIQLKLLSFGGDHDIEEKIKLVKGEKIKTNILDQEINIERVYELEENTYVEFTTEDNVRLSRVYLNIDGKKFTLEEAIPGDIEKIVEGDKGRIDNTRTMRFKGTGKELELDIQRIRFNIDYDTVIYSYNIR